MLTLLFRNPALRSLWFGEVVSLLGDWLTYVAISLLALEQGRGLQSVAVVLIAHTLPSAVLSPLAGYWVDRFDRRTVLVVASVLRGLVTSAMALAAYSGYLGIAQACLLVRTALSAFHEPASQATVARVVPASDLLAANALLAATWSTVFTLGVAAGGLLSAIVGPVTAVALDAVTFFVAAVFLARLPRLEPERTDSAAPGSIGRELLQAWTYAGERPALWRAVLGKTPMSLGTGGAWILLNHVGQGKLWLLSTATTVGLLHAARAAGTGIGPIVWRHTVGRRWPHAPHDIATVFAVIGITSFIASKSPTGIVASIVLWGAGAGANWVVTTTRIQQLARDEFRGRLSAIDFFGLAVGLSFGAWASAWIGEALSPRIGATALAAVCLTSTLSMRAFPLRRRTTSE